MAKLRQFATLATLLTLLAACGGGGGGGDEGSLRTGTSWLIPQDEIRDGGPGKDGIPAINNPVFVSPDLQPVTARQLMIGMSVGGQARAASHDIMDWHEVLNMQTPTGPTTMSYCPLTGSALYWQGNENDNDPTFGVSGLLYNSNLILYDRETDSNWSQMRVQAVQGNRQGQRPSSLPVVEMTIESWREMYPDANILSQQTGFSRDYGRYPYGGFRTNTDLLFPVDILDERIHPKERVLGISENGVTRAYVVSQLESGIQVINDDFDGVPVVIVGSSSRRFAVAFERTLSDGTELTFLSTDEPFPSVVEDDDGNTWDVFGQGVTGTRAGQQLTLPENAHIAYWFAWAAFNKESEIYQQ